MPLELDVIRGFDQISEAFAAHVDTQPYNAYYDRPATLSLLPPVAGARVLDAGCGPGVYAEWLAEHGASVVGIDASTRMVALARQRLGGKAEVRRASLDQPLSSFETATFDGVLSALVLDYVRDWDQVFHEFRRLLRPAGWLVFSVEHPSHQFYAQPNGGDYFATEGVERRWRWPGHKSRVRLPQYRRPLAAMLQPLLAAGFVLRAVLEPRPVPEFKLLEPDEYAKLMRQPGFICFRAEAAN